MDDDSSLVNVQLLVRAPVKTKEIMMALRDWEPQKGIRFTLAKRKGFLLLFDTGTPSGYQARGLALQRLKESGLDETPDLDVSVL